MGVAQIIAFCFIPLSLICIIRPFFIVYLLAASQVLIFFPTLTNTDRQGKIFQIGSINIFAFDFLYIVLLLVVISTLLKSFLTNKIHIYRILSSSITKVILIMFVWSLFISILSYLKGFEFQNIVRAMFPDFLMILVIYYPLLSDIDIKKHYFYNYCLWNAILLTLFGLIRYYITNDFEYTSSGTKRSLTDSTINIFLFPLCYILFFKSHWQARKVFKCCLIFIFSIGIGLSGHRSGWVVLFFILGSYFLSSAFNKKKYLWVPFFAMSIIPVLVCVYPIIRDQSYDSFFAESLIRIADTSNANNKTTIGRIDKWMMCWQIFKEHPIMGLGRKPISTDYVDPTMNPQLKSFGEFNKDAHNFIAKKIAHEGIVGLGLLFIFIYWILKEVKLLSKTDMEQGNFIKFYLYGFFILCMFNPTFDNISCRIYFLSIIGFINAEKIMRDNNPLNTAQYY